MDAKRRFPQEAAAASRELMQKSRYGAQAAIIGAVTEPSAESEAGELVLRTRIGGHRLLDILQGEGLPRIC